MNTFLRMTSLAATAAALALSATPALAVGPSDKNATATARVVKPPFVRHGKILVPVE